MSFYDWKCGNWVVNIQDKLEEFAGLSILLKQISKQDGGNH
jgi:hypothetical protein